jgi:hypothetical protein
MKNVVLHGIQCTVDFSYTIESNDLTLIANEWSKGVGAAVPRFTEPRHTQILNSIATTGLLRDEKLSIGDVALMDSVRDYLAQREKSQGKKYPQTQRIGGNPAISAIRGYYLGRGAEHSQLPLVYYIGLYPRSVAQHVQDVQTADRRSVFDEVFKGKYTIYKRPQSIALEAERKLILGYGEGCTLDHMDKDNTDQFEWYLGEIGKIVEQTNIGGAIIALSVPWPLDRGENMIKRLKERFADRAGLFIGTGSFRRDEAVPDPQRTRDIYEKILKHADIISLNETELEDLHTIIVGEGAYQDVSLANKLKDLPINAIKICHSAYGAILDIGCDPGRIIKSQAFQKDPYKYLLEALQLSVDGATYAIDAARVGQVANEPMIRVYSGSITERADQLFRNVFQKTVENLPGGIISAKAPLVSQRRAALTGVGAMFDGLVVSFIMRD